MVEIKSKGRLFYKYQAVDDNLITNFKNNQLYFNNPCRFNDPFDSRIYYHHRGNRSEWISFLLKQGHSKSDSEKFLDDNIRLNLYSVEGDEIYIKDEKHIDPSYHGSIPQAMLPTTCCFSETSENILLWSHYGDRHRGLCLIFRSVPYHNSYALYKDNENTCFLFDKIEYSDDALESINMINADSNSLQMKRVLLNKSLHWEYEKEYRLIGHIFSDSVFKGIPIRYDKSHLEGIIFGLKTTQTHMKKVFDIVQRYYIEEGVDVKFYKAFEIPRKYAIEIREIDSIEDYIS